MVHTVNNLNHRSRELLQTKVLLRLSFPSTSASAQCQGTLATVPKLKPLPAQRCKHRKGPVLPSGQSGSSVIQPYTILHSGGTGSTAAQAPQQKDVLCIRRCWPWLLGLCLHSCFPVSKLPWSRHRDPLGSGTGYCHVHDRRPCAGIQQTDF